MPKRITVNSLLLLVGASLVRAQQPCGSVIGTYKGVNAYSNDTDTGTLRSCRNSPVVIVDPADSQAFAGEDGLQYQCVELVRRFYREAVCSQSTCPVPPSRWHGTYGNAQDFYPHADYFGLVGFPNGGTIPPQPNDIIGFSTAVGDLGHVAIVEAVDTTSCMGLNQGQFTVHLLEQNTSRLHQLTGQCERQANSTYTYMLTPRSIPIQGWLRLPTQVQSTGRLALFKTLSINGDYAVAGVGVRGSGFGTISMNGVPVGVNVVAAYLYWETLGDGQHATFRGAPIVGVALGTAPSPCWSPPSITVYRADVLGLLPRDSQGHIYVDGAHDVRFPDSGDFDTAPSTEGASLVAIYTLPGLPYKRVFIYDGAFTTLPSIGQSFNLVINGFQATLNSDAKITHIVGDGQAAGDQAFMDTLSVNGTVLGDPSQAFAGTLGPMWDTLTSDISTLVPPDASSVTTTVAWPPNATQNRDCLTVGAVVFSTTIAAP